jgi:hypothetical protein
MSGTWREELTQLARENGIESIPLSESEANSDDSDNSESSSDDESMAGVPPHRCAPLLTPLAFPLHDSCSIPMCAFR